MHGVEDRVARQIELVERIQPEHARAMHRHADRLVLLDDNRAESGRSEIARGEKPGGAAADNDNVTPAGRQYLRPLDSHVPRKLIQNDRRIKRISSPNDRC